MDELLSDVEDLNNGGAALTAYGFLQYTDITQQECDKITEALLRYCELDTLAMVMLWEHFGEGLIIILVKNDLVKILQL